MKKFIMIVIGLLVAQIVSAAVIEDTYECPEGSVLSRGRLVTFYDPSPDDAEMGGYVHVYYAYSIDCEGDIDESGYTEPLLTIGMLPPSPNGHLFPGGHIENGVWVDPVTDGSGLLLGNITYDQVAGHHAQWTPAGGPGLGWVDVKPFDPYMGILAHCGCR